MFAATGPTALALYLPHPRRGDDAPGKPAMLFIASPGPTTAQNGGDAMALLNWRRHAPAHVPALGTR